MFRKLRRAKDSVRATAILVDVAATNDNQALMDTLSGRGALDEPMVGRALVGLLGFAAEYPSIRMGLADAAAQAPDFAQVPFRSALSCADAGSPSAFIGDNLQGQQLLMATLARLVANDPVAYRDLRRSARLA